MTFAGLKIVFSSVIPLDVPPETTDIWRTATAFGAECYKELNPTITHVVANKVRFYSRRSPDPRTDSLLPSFRIEGHGESRSGSTASKDRKSVDQDRLAGMVQRLSCVMEAARRDSLSAG